MAATWRTARKWGPYGFLMFSCMGVLLTLIIRKLYIMPQLEGGRGLLINMHDPKGKEPEYGLKPYHPAHVSQVYYYNITNLAQFLNGSQPIIKKCGPYGAKPTVVNFNVSFEENLAYRTKAEFMEFEPAGSCPNCSLDDVIVFPFLAYNVWVAAFGGSEWVWMAGMSQYFLGERITIIERALAFAGLGTTGTPELRALAVQQWANCSILDGLSVSAHNDTKGGMRNPAIVPEYCAVTGKNMTAEEATRILYTGPTWARIGNGPVSNAPINFLYAKNSDLIGGLNITESTVLGVRAWISNVIITGTMPWWRSVTINANGGRFIAKTVREIWFGFRDPIQAAQGRTVISKNYHDLSVLERIRNGTMTIPHMNGTRIVHRVKDPNKMLYIVQGDILGGSVSGAVWNGRSVVYPNGTVNVTGGDGISYHYGMATVAPDKVHPFWFDSYARPLNLTFNHTFHELMTDFYRFKVGRENYQSCARNPGNCVYGMTQNGVINIGAATKVNGMFLHQPNWLYADPHYRASLGASADFTYDPENETRDSIWFDIHPETGYSWRYNYAVGFSVEMRRTDLYYKTLWLAPNMTSVWVPMSASYSSSRIRSDAMEALRTLSVWDMDKNIDTLSVGICMVDGVVLSLLLIAYVWYRDRWGGEDKDTVSKLPVTSVAWGVLDSPDGGASYRGNGSVMNGYAPSQTWPASPA
eukprot:jgi/Mesvir1/448/Mv11326-RA.1